jgi:hypothetical protein
VQRVDEQAGVDELVGEQAVALVAEEALELDRARGVVDLVVDRLQRAGVEHLLPLAVPRLHAQLVALRHPRHHRRELVGGQREDDRDGLELRDHEQPARVGRVHHVPRIDQAQAHAARDGRGDPAVGEVESRVGDLRFVRLDRALELVDGGHLRVDLLARDRVLLQQGLVAREVEARVLQRGLVLRELALLLLDRHLERPRIDLGQQVALAHELAFAVADGDELAVHAAAHGHGVDGRDRT